VLRAVALALLLAPRPPVARQVDEVVATLHGEPRRDEYAWLRAGPDDPAVRAYLDAENRYAAAVLRPQRRLLRALEREIEARAYVTHETAPVRRGAWLYWERWAHDRDHPVVLRRPADPGRQAEAPQVVLDLEALARGKPFLDLGVFEVSDDGRWLAYAIDEVGGEDHTLYFKDLEAGTTLPERVDRVTSAAWSAGGRELLYTVRDDTFRSYALRGRTRGGRDRLIFEERDARFDLDVARSRSGEWLLLRSESYVATEVRVMRADLPAGPWTVISPREVGHLYDVDHAGDVFYVRSNRGAPYFRVLAAPEADPRPAKWKVVVPERPGVAVTAVDAFSGHLALLERDRGRPRVSLVELASGRLYRAGDAAAQAGQVARTQTLATRWAGENPDPGSPSYRVHVETAQAPAQTVDIALADGQETLVQQRPAGGPCGAPGQRSGVARAADGAEIPYVVVGGGGEGPRPLLLEAYGAYGSTYDPDYDAARCALLARGVDFAIAWVRGGGELGEPWHEAARQRRRAVAAGDLIAVAEALIAAGATTRARLVVAGDSAGGGLVAAAVNQRPELFAAAVLRVPFLDAVGTMADPAAPLTTIEYDEWGDPGVLADYEVLRAWCPYTNLGPRAYPAVLVESSLADGRVAYHEQARYVARLRRVARGGGPFLLRTETHAGHGGASGRRQWLRGRALEVAFILSRVGLAN
jgi:oligopeptidase B